jgi:hypothetical protein
MEENESIGRIIKIEAGEMLISMLAARANRVLLDAKRKST